MQDSDIAKISGHTDLKSLAHYDPDLDLEQRIGAAGTLASRKSSTATSKAAGSGQVTNSGSGGFSAQSFDGFSTELVSSLGSSARGLGGEITIEQVSPTSTVVSGQASSVSVRNHGPILPLNPGTGSPEYDFGPGISQGEPFRGF